MVKRWKNVDEINELNDATEVPRELRVYNIIMQEVPDFNRVFGAKKIYSRKEYIILRVKKGYIIYNQNKSFKEGHTHIRSYTVAKTIIDNCINRKRPKTKNIYLLESHIRISTNEKYINLLKELIENNKTKEKYINDIDKIIKRGG